MNRVVVVTGGAGEIGRAIALAFHREEDHPIVLDIDADRLNASRAWFGEKGVRIEHYKVDVSKYGDVEQAFHDIREKYGKLDVLVNNAGISGIGKTLVELSISEWHEMIRTDLDSVFYCCRAAVPIMVAGRQGGRIINMSSATALTGMAGSTHYAAAKAGIIGLSKSLALELAQYLITVNAVAPGIIDTQLMRRRWATRPRPAIPWPRIGTVDDVAALVVFLASPGAEFITGQVISPNGGQVT